MKKISIFVSLLVAAALIAFYVHAFSWTAGSTSNFEKDMPQTHSLIRLGKPQLSDLNGSGSSIDNHPTGATFYQQVWQQGALGTVEFAHGPHSFVVENVLSILGSADKDVPEGIYDWNINFGVSPEEADTHEAARDRVMRFLSQLRAAGWKRYISTNRPRLGGKQAWQYNSLSSVDGIYSLDSTYIPTIEEWKSAVKNRPKWVFEADGVYLEVVVDESNMGGFVGKSTYLLGVEMKSEYAFYGVGYFPGDAEKIENWKELIPAELAKYHQDRLRREAELKAAGYTIDTAYQDPPIKSLQDSHDSTR